MCISQNHSESLMREFSDKIDWEVVSHYRTLSEQLIRDFQDKVDWKKISRHQIISEQFIREFQEKVNWKKIIDTNNFPKIFALNLKTNLIGTQKNYKLY